MFKFADLKEYQREKREQLSPALALRTHRALSWLYRAEQEENDHDARFLFLWISFNAAYANEARDSGDFTERKMLQQFLQRLVDSDHEKLLDRIVWEQFSGSIRVLIDNQYVFQPFWRWQAGLITEHEWHEAFDNSKSAAHRALGKADTTKVLAIIFDRLYTLRNQVVHGGSTWGGQVNRAQLRDGSSILGFLVPTVIHLMMEDHNQVWGDACYPVIE